MLLEEFNPTGDNCYLVVTGDSAPITIATTLPPCPVICIGKTGTPAAFDVLLDDAQELEHLAPNLMAQPLACTTLVQLLRSNATTTVADGLFAESLAYSTLQQSRGFRAWLSEGNVRNPVPDEDPIILLERDADVLTVTLNRPAAHNAYSAALKDALCAALQLAHTDPTITQVVLRGNGASFCAGGDLSEFGQLTDAALAHASRTTRSAASLLAHLKCTTKVKLHGACIGAGIEISAFAGDVTARQETFFQLPEVSMGLVPGAGGTVSISRRIGRQKTAYMAITGQRFDAPTALQWGLIDSIEDSIEEA